MPKTAIHNSKSASQNRMPLWPLVLLGYLALGLAMTWPLVLRITSNLPGDVHKDGLEDAYQNVWNLWWTVEALGRPTNLWVTDMLFHPDGPNLLFHTLSPINTLMVAPVTALWGPIAGFNAVVLASFALGGLGMWLLARQRCGPGPALLAGIVYVASPFHLAAIVFDGQLQIFALQWLPWYIHFFLLALRPQPPPPGPNFARPSPAYPRQPRCALTPFSVATASRWLPPGPTRPLCQA